MFVSTNNHFSIWKYFVRYSICLYTDNKSKWERAVFLLSLWMKDSSTVPGPCDQWPYSNNNERADLRSNRSLLFYSKSTFNDLYTPFELFLYISVQQNVTQGVHCVVTPY